MFDSSFRFARGSFGKKKDSDNNFGVVPARQSSLQAVTTCVSSVCSEDNRIQ